MPERLFPAAAETDAATVRFAEALAAQLAALARRGGSATSIVPSAARICRYLAERERIRLSRIVLLAAMGTANAARKPAAESLLQERSLNAAVRRAMEAIRENAPLLLAASGLDELQRTFAAIQSLLNGPRRRPPAPPWLAGAARLHPPVFPATRQTTSRKAQTRAIAARSAKPVRNERSLRGPR